MFAFGGEKLVSYGLSLLGSDLYLYIRAAGQGVHPLNLSI